MRELGHTRRFLILGGTHEGRYLANQLVAHGEWVMTSLAGRVKNPALPAGEVRIGGFGGPEGLARWIKENQIDVVIDATHPYAERISASAEKATEELGIPLYVVERPLWQPQPGDRWISCPNMQAAADYIAKHYSAKNIFLTIGRQQLAPFQHDAQNSYIIRCVEKPEVPLPPQHELVLDRGPFEPESELNFMKKHQVDVLVTKNSGSEATYPKLDAARKIGAELLMVERPRVEHSYGIRTEHCCQVLAQLGYSVE
ncbi:MAG: cobalt-precorrin-6A reductase [Corynebacterium sp.]|nr:cobalt-precorrin-6A reductase [Corynebacterium sp.]